MATENEKRRMLRERRILRSQARWLQKAIFALSKAEDAHSKFLDEGGESVDSFDVSLNGSAYHIDEVTLALKDAVTEWLEAMQAVWHKEHALSR